MQPNDLTNPSVSRAAQDVTAPAHHVKEPKGTYHWGRGGEGNSTCAARRVLRVSTGRALTSDSQVMTLGKPEQDETPKSRTNSKPGSKRPSFGAVVGRGKDMLGLGKRKEGSTKTSESAIEDEESA